MDRFSTRLAASLIEDRRRDAASSRRLAVSVEPGEDRAWTGRGSSVHRTHFGRAIVLWLAAAAASVRQAR